MHAVSKMSPVMVLPPTFGGGSDDHVTCRMCLLKFSYPARLPLSLNCLHTYCSQCVYGWTCNTTKQKLPCPMCGKITKVEKGRKVTDCLPVNHAVLELVAMSATSNNGYQNGHAQMVPDISQAFNRLNLPEMGQFRSSNDQLASSLFLSAGMPDRINTGSPSNFHQGPVVQVGGGCHDAVTNYIKQCENNKIYPDLANNQHSQCNAFIPSPTPNVQTTAPTDCGCKKTEPEKQDTGCCGNKPLCSPVTGKSEPPLSINIGSMRFQKSSDKDVVEEISCARRHDSPCRVPEAGQQGAVTELSVNRSPNFVKRFPEMGKTSCIPKINSDLCVKCNVNPATVTITNSAAKSVQRLCAECHAACKEEKKNDCGGECRPKPVPQDPPNNQARTVVKVQSKLNNEAARCSPVGEIRMRQSHCDSDKKVSNMPSVLVLGDQVRTVVPNAACNNQVGVVCGPFKSEQAVTSCSEESNNRCQEINECRVQALKAEVNSTGQAARSRDRDDRRTRRPEPSTAIDIGTVDSALVGRKASANIRAQLTAPVIERREVVRESSPRTNRREGQESGFRPTEYIVSPVISSGGRGTVRGQRASEAVISAEELSRQDAYNPQYSEDFDARSISDLGLPTVEPVNLMQRATTKEQEALGYSQQQQVSSNNGTYPTLSSPPKYEDIMAEAQRGGMSAGGGDFIPRFGKYGESSSQPGVMRNPSGVSVSSDDLVTIADTQNRTVQVFGGHTGECLSLLRVEGVNGCCMARNGSLVVASNKGVEVYKANGVLSKKVDMGPVINAVAYRNGFVAVQPKALVAFRDMNGGTSKTLTEMWKTGQFNQNKSFRNITDMAVTNQQDYIVLDSGTIYMISDEGCVKSVVRPQNQPCGALAKPTAIDVDERNNIIVCDPGSSRVLLFNPSGQYTRDVFEPIVRRGLGSVVPIALGIGRNGKVYIAVKGERRAETIALSYL